MQYIILDMEWNQPWPGSYSAKKASPMRGEIVQIGAVRMTQEQQVADEFQILIRPKYFKKMNRKVASLTGIRDSVLREKGVSFPEAAAIRASKISSPICSSVRSPSMTVPAFRSMSSTCRSNRGVLEAIFKVGKCWLP